MALRIRPSLPVRNKHVHVRRSGNIYYIFGQVQWVMSIGVNFSVMFKFFGHIHSVILNRSSDYSLNRQNIILRKLVFLETLTN